MESKTTDIKIDLDVSTEVTSDNENSSTSSEDKISACETENKVTSKEQNEIEFLEENVKSSQEIKFHFQRLRDRIYNLVVGVKKKYGKEKRKEICTLL